MNYDALPNLKVQEYEHPGEKKAMAALRAIPGVDDLMGAWIDTLIKYNSHPEIAGNRYRVTEKTNPRVYKLYQTALARLDMPKEYPLYAELSFHYNAGALGVEDPIILVNSSNIANFSDAALLRTLGHELGHIKSGHCLYHSMANKITSKIGKMGGLGETAATALQYAIMEWKRNAEYTCDRAGMIACGGIDGCIESHMRYLGYSDKLNDIDFSLDKVVKQIDDFHMQTDDVLGKLIYVYSISATTHPWQIMRLREILNWYNSGAFDELIKAHT